MNFFDEKPHDLAPDGQYYFNVLVKTIAVNPQCADIMRQQNLDELVSIEHITDARPYIIYCYIGYHLDKDTEYEIECCPHCVVEVSATEGITWWDMLDFDTDDFWRIDLDEETYY